MPETQQTSQPGGLEAVILQGARFRRNFHFKVLRAVIPPSFGGAVVAFSIYVLVMLSAGRSDWGNILWVGCASAAIPLVTIGLLVVGSRRSHPFTVSLAMVIFATSLMISVVAALRVPVSFLGIFLTLPGSLFFSTLANVNMSRAWRRNVVLLEFPEARKVVTMANWSLPVVGPENIDPAVERLLIDPATHHSARWAPELAKFYMRGMRIEAWPSYIESSVGRVDLNTFDLADVSYSSSQILYYRAKRAIDILGVIVLGLPAIFISAIIWVYIRALDGGPSIFVQERRGYAGSTFRLYKFRTMYAGGHGGSTSVDDARIMPGCKILRQMRLDELPQLFNILKGEMSFIGPRPVAVSVAEAIEASIPLYVNRHILLPGLTGWAQVSQGYAETQEEEIEKLAYDLYYLKNVSLDLDIIIVFRTIRTILLRFGGR